MSSDRASRKSSNDSSENEIETSQSICQPVNISPSKSQKASSVGDSKDELEEKHDKNLEVNASSNHQKETKDTAEMERTKNIDSENVEKEIQKHKNDKPQTRSPSPKKTNKKSRSQSPRNYEEKRSSDKRKRKYPEKKHDSKYDKVRHRSKSPSKNDEMGKERSKNKQKSSEHTDKNKQILTTKTGGAYIPPAKLRLMQEQITDKSSEQFQRLAWEALKKSINGLINKVNSPNIGIIVREIFAENIVRGRGLLCLSIMQAQTASPTFTHVYAALGAIINSKFPNIGELLLKRLIVNFKRGYKRNDKIRCVSSTRFIAHLVNQQVAHEVLALEILTLLLESPTDDSVEIAIAFLKECGQKLTEVSPRGINAIFERLRHVLHESKLDKRTQYMIEVMFQVRKDGFKDNVAIPEELDVVEEEDQFTHMFTLDDATVGEEVLNVFKLDTDYEGTEEKYQEIKKELLGEESSDENGDGSSDESDSSDQEKEGNEEDTSAPIIDQTETNMIALRRTIYLTIQSSLDFEETVHKLMKLNLKPGHEPELCHMIIDCCAQQRTYEKFFGLTAQRLCMVKREYIEPFQKIFQDCYSTVHRLELGKLRNIARVFAHLLFTDAISWEALSAIHLNEHETTSSSRIFIKILFQELAEYMGLSKLNDRIRDTTLQSAFDGLFPRDDPANTRFSVNFFTNIGLGGLTEDLRNHLKSNPKPIARVAPIIQNEGKASSTSSTSSSSSSSTDSEDEKEKRKKERKRKKKQKKKDKKRKKNSSNGEDRKPKSNEMEHNGKSGNRSEDYMSVMMEKMRTQQEGKEKKIQEQNKNPRNRRNERSNSRDGGSRSRRHLPDSEDESHLNERHSREGRRNAPDEKSYRQSRSDRPKSRNRDIQDSELSYRGSREEDQKKRIKDRSFGQEESRRGTSYGEGQSVDRKKERNKSPYIEGSSSRVPTGNTRESYKSPRSYERSPQSRNRRERSKSKEASYRRKRSRDKRRDSSSSSDEEKLSLRDKDKRSYEKRISKDSRWGQKEKEWKDPLLPKSNAVYKDTLKGMLELLQQDADIKRKKELADNPEKALLAKEQVGKMEKAAIKKPSENRPGDWKCSKKDCGNINFAWRNSCNNCDTEKSENAQDYKEDRHEHADWFVGAVKTEEKSMESNIQKNKRSPSPRAIDEQSSSDENSRRTESSRHGNSGRHSRERRKVEEVQIDRRYHGRSHSRERDSYRREQGRKSKMTR